MTNKEYQSWAVTKDRNYNEFGDRLTTNTSQLKLMHSVMGMAGEVGELTDSVKKHILYKKPLDITNLKEEAGDILWYMSLLLQEIDSSFDEVMHLNKAKLDKRYPNGYNDEDAVKRADKL